MNNKIALYFHSFYVHFMAALISFVDKLNFVFTTLNVD